MEQLESGFNGTINWNKGQSKITEQLPNRYLDFLIDPIDRNKKISMLRSMEEISLVNQ